MENLKQTIDQLNKLIEQTKDQQEELISK